MDSFCIIADIRGVGCDLDRMREMGKGFPQTGAASLGAFLDKGVGVLCASAASSQGVPTQPYAIGTPQGELYFAIDTAARSSEDTLKKLANSYPALRYDTPKALDGHFALAVFDRARRELLLATDPLAAKPLFLHLDGAKIVLSTSIKSLLRYSPECAEADKRAVIELLRAPDGEVSAGDVYKNISELKGGHFMLFSGLGAQIFKYSTAASAPPTPQGALTLQALSPDRSADLKRSAEEMTTALDIPAFDAYTPEYIAAIRAAAHAGTDAFIKFKRQSLYNSHTYRKLYALAKSFGISVYLQESENDVYFKRSFLAEREKKLLAAVRAILNNENSHIKRHFGASLETIVSKSSSGIEKIALLGKIIGLEHWLESYPIIPI